MCPVADRWQHVDPADITEVTRVTYSDPAHPRNRLGPVTHGRGWTSYNEDTLEWEVMTRTGLECRHDEMS